MAGPFRQPLNRAFQVIDEEKRSKAADILDGRANYLMPADFEAMRLNFNKNKKRMEISIIASAVTVSDKTQL